MLKSARAPYPQPNSWGLIEEGGRYRAVRITNLVDGEDGREAVVSVAGEFTASATKRLPLAAVLNADPLTPAEVAELAALDQKLAGKSRVAKADRAREEELGNREQRASALEAMLAKVPEKYFPAAAAAGRMAPVGAAA